MNSTPFHHLVLDNFLGDSIKKSIPDEFPSRHSDIWFEYNSPLEVKKTCSDWSKMPPSAYEFFMQACSPHFVTIFSEAFGVQLIPDIGLHGGGMHTHGPGGKLNPHLDYSLHPKMRLQRRVNLIVYVTPDWQEEWGGHLGLWSGDSEKPDKLVAEIAPLFGRAVLFDTTENSWHGLSREVKCPLDVSRNSFAMYYLAEPKEGAATNRRAKFAPTPDQEGDPEVMSIIHSRLNGEGRK
jgi:hypothetical protein